MFRFTNVFHIKLIFVFFKKYKIKKTQESPKVLPYLIASISILVIFGFWIKVVDSLSAIEMKILGISETSSTEKHTERTSTSSSKDNKSINILLLGRWGWNHDAPDLTDTIILASVDLEKDTVSMLSIPRDLYVAYPKSAKKRSGKINRLYETYLYSTESDYAITAIKEKVSEITGQEIDFYVNVDFEWFTEIIDIIWWVEVTVPENFVDYEYPDGNLGYTTFILRKWTWTLDGTTALKYARSRHSTSDFDRSLRQQQILIAMKNKVLWLWYLRDSGKIRELYSALSTYIETDLDIATIVKLALDFKAWWDKEIFSFNLNDTCFEWSPVCDKWGFLYVPQRDFFWGQSVLLPENADVSRLSEYKAFDSYMSLIFNYQEVFQESIPISVYNATQTKFLAGSLSDTLKKYGFSIPKKNSVGNIREKKFEKSILYYNSDSSNSATISLLWEILGMEIQSKQEAVLEWWAPIEIVLWEDFTEVRYLEID